MKICIIGAGAAGMVAAINVANENNEVFILEHTSKIGSKIRISGNGKCNLTNESVSKEKYNNQDFADVVLNEFSVEDTKKFFYNCGLILKEKNGAKYTKSHDVVKLETAWKSKDKSLACKLEYQIKQISKDKKEALINGEKLATFFKGKIDCRRYRRINV